MKEYEKELQDSINRFENWIFWDRAQWSAIGALTVIVIRLVLDYLWANGIL